MTISEFKKYFKTALSEVYSDSESAFLAAVFIEKIIGIDSFHQRRLSGQELLLDDEKQLMQVISDLKNRKTLSADPGRNRVLRDVIFC
ncbi:Uncharacterised protein [Chryseobacterium carnipullorum]|uniref:Uncharacterized protein n=1 Tax=Chryseobacterium carnipullorum TaxID=1124835 RepID=A0A376DVS9_CHRCU|nr:Uncharacterised protein [Chryseobacterium carnipullorum]